MGRGSYNSEDGEDSDIDPEVLQERRRWADETLETYEDEPVYQEPHVVRVTDTTQNRNMERWIQWVFPRILYSIYLRLCS